MVVFTFWQPTTHLLFGKISLAVATV